MWRRDNKIGEVEDGSSRVGCCLNGVAVGLGICIVIALAGVVNMQVHYKSEQNKERLAYQEELKSEVSKVQAEIDKWEGYKITLTSGTALVLPSSYSFESLGEDRYELSDGSVLKLSDYNESDNLSDKREELLKEKGRRSDITGVQSLNSYIRYFVDYSAGVVGKRTCYFVYDSSVYGEVYFTNNTVDGTSVEQFLSQLTLGLHGDYTEMINDNIEELNSRLSYIEGKVQELEKEK